MIVRKTITLFFYVMKKFAEAFYKSKSWKKCRNAYFVYRHGICERCGEAGKIVHHKIKLTPKNINDPRITLNFKYLELHCEKCHRREHEKDIKRGRKEKKEKRKPKQKQPARYRIDEYGNILPPGSTAEHPHR